MDTLEQLIAKFDREYPDDMKLARKALQANPLKASDLIDIDITDALLCHEITRLRAELAAMTGKRDRLRDALKEYGRHKNGCWVPCNCGFDDALDEAIDAALAAKEE